MSIFFKIMTGYDNERGRERNGEFCLLLGPVTATADERTQSVKSDVS